jgi:hypothetical protein
MSAAVDASGFGSSLPQPAVIVITIMMTKIIDIALFI